MGVLWDYGVRGARCDDVTMCIKATRIGSCNYPVIRSKCSVISGGLFRIIITRRPRIFAKKEFAVFASISQMLCDRGQ
jgi:hypothetical protein